MKTLLFTAKFSTLSHLQAVVLLYVDYYCRLCLLLNSLVPVSRKFMVCTDHRLECEKSNRTNNKLHATEPENSKGSEINSNTEMMGSLIFQSKISAAQN